MMHPQSSILERAEQVLLTPAGPNHNPTFRGGPVMASAKSSQQSVDSQPKCRRCGQPTPKRPTPRAFCSEECIKAAMAERMSGNTRRKGLKPANSFAAGHLPWNKDVKGIHLSPESEFKKGVKSVNHLPVGSETIRTDKSGNLRVWVKVAEPKTWRLRAVVVWEKANGSVPNGYVVHHKNRNSLDDSIDNLQMMTRAEHINEHRSEFPKPAPERHESLSLFPESAP